MNSNNKIQIDVSLIPEHVKEDLAAATLEAFKRFMKNPEAKKMLEEKKKELFGLQVDYNANAL